MRHFRLAVVLLILSSPIVAGCDGGPSSSQLDEANKQNVEDELKAMKNAETKRGKGV